MVCQRWQHLLCGETRWHEFVMLRWPLFNPKYKVKKWKMIYSKLLESSPCRYCLENMRLQSTPPIEESSWRHRRLRSELKTLRSDPPEGIRAEPLDRHCCHWQASITGPRGSPFERGGGGVCSYCICRFKTATQCDHQECNSSQRYFTQTPVVMDTWVSTPSTTTGVWR